MRYKLGRLAPRADGSRNWRGIRRLSLAGGVAAVLALTGCSLEQYPEIPRYAESGGQTVDQLAERLATIPGLTFTEAVGSQPNAKGNTGFAFDMTLDPAYEVADAPALVDFLTKSAWSVRDGYQPNVAVEISLFAGESADSKVDIVAAAEDGGWVPIGTQSHRMTEDDGGSAPEFANGYTSVSVWLDNVSTSGTVRARGGPENRERLGDWPGPAPEVPDGLTRLRTAD